MIEGLMLNNKKSEIIYNALWLRQIYYQKKVEKG